jgi:hypothetical protein
MIRTCRSFVGWKICFFLFLPLSAIAQNPEDISDQGLVVWRLRANQGVSESEIDSLSGVVTAETARISGRKVISEADVQTLLQGEQKRQECGGQSASCVAEIGNALGVPEVMTGDLGRVGELWILNLRRIDVRKVEVIARVSKRVRGDITALVDDIPNAVAELFGQDPPVKQVGRGEVPLRDVGQMESGDELAGLHQQVEPPSRPLHTWGWTATGTGIGMLIVGAVATWMAKSSADDYHNGNQGAEDTNKMWSDTMIAGYAVGGALVVTGMALLIADALEGESSKEEEVRITFGPAVDPQGFQVFIRGRW